MNKEVNWQWQEEGTAWKGIGIYHVTLTVSSREPLLGTLVIPGNDPSQARVDSTELGRALLDCQRSVPVFHPEIQILQYCLMPDHLHAIWYVRRPMEKSIRQAVQGFWRVAKKMGRAYTYLNARSRQTGGTTNETASPAAGMSAFPVNIAVSLSSISPADSRETPLRPLSLSSISPADSREAPLRPLSLSSISPADSRETPLRALLGNEAYSRLTPIFTEMPFIRPMSRRGQLQTMIRYVQLNPQRLATKRLMPGYFRVQKGIVVANRIYSGVGNISLLLAECYATVHVRHELVDEEAQGRPQRLRDYMNGCVLAARHGVVMVSPFISPKERAVKDVLLVEQHPFILLADNGFRDYYKPSDNLFDAVAAGRVLILSPWEYDASKRHITRTDCIALNAMAEEIASLTHSQ